jgi:hypothetical protein
MKTFGIIIIILGALGSIFFGIHGVNQTEDFKLLGYEFPASTYIWAPFTISLFVLLVGVLMLRARREVRS